MKFSITYPELETLIAEMANIKLSIQHVNEKTVRVGYSPSRFIPDILVEVRVNAVRRDIISFAYDCNKAIMMVIGGVIEHLRNRLPRGLEVDAEHNIVSIYPLYIKQLDEITRYITVTNITFNNLGVEIEAVVNGSDTDWRGNEYCHFAPDKD